MFPLLTGSTLGTPARKASTAASAQKPQAAGPKELFALPRFAPELDQSADAAPGDRDAAPPECLELPRPTALVRTIGWNIVESFGLPTGAFAVATALWGREGGLWAMLRSEEHTSGL